MNNDSTIQNQSKFSFESSIVQDLSEEKTVYCPSKNLSIQICQNPKCTNNAFICEQKECQCQLKHSKCFTLNMKKFIKTINSKRISTQFLENFIDTKIQDLIDSISKFHDETKKWIQNQLQFLGLNQNEKEFLDNFKKSNLQSITGQKIWQIIHPQQQQMELNEFINQNLEILSTILKETQITLNDSFKKIKEQIQSYEQKIFQGNGTILSNFMISKQKSKVLTQKNESKVMKDLFHPRKIKSAKLLYCASENSFQTNKFHQKCDSISNTLILVETQFGKKIGGFTPNKWSNPNTGSYFKDEQMKSFLFSLTNGDKFNLIKKDQAIVNNNKEYMADKISLQQIYKFKNSFLIIKYLIIYFCQLKLKLITLFREQNSNTIKQKELLIFKYKILLMDQYLEMVMIQSFLIKQIQIMILMEILILHTRMRSMSSKINSHGRDFVVIQIHTILKQNNGKCGVYSLIEDLDITI